MMDDGENLGWIIRAQDRVDDGWWIKFMMDIGKSSDAWGIKLMMNDG